MMDVVDTKPNLGKSAIGRAYRDTQRIVTGELWFWIFDGLLSIAVAAIARSAWWGAAVLIGVVVLVFGVSVLRAPILQRDEARRALREAREAKSQIPAALSRFILRGTTLRHSLLDSWSDGRIREVEEWTERVLEYLTEQVPEMAGHFVNDGGFPPKAYVGNLPRSRTLVHLEHRLQRLSEILMKVTS